MGKSKVYLNSKIILFIFAILIALACSKKLSAAETATFAISNVTIGQKEATVTKNTKDDSVYTAQVDERSIGDGYIISGKADVDAQISATDFEGKEMKSCIIVKTTQNKTVKNSPKPSFLHKTCGNEKFFLQNR